MRNVRGVFGARWTISLSLNAFELTWLLLVLLLLLLANLLRMGLSASVVVLLAKRVILDLFSLVIWLRREEMSWLVLLRSLITFVLPW
jgi:hypothetical protein